MTNTMTGFEVAITVNQLVSATLDQDWDTQNQLLDRLSECEPRRLVVVFAAEYAYALRSLRALRYPSTRVDTLTRCEHHVVSPFEAERESTP